MLRSKDVKGVLNTIPAGKTLPLAEIQKMIADQCKLTKEDLAPHTHTRPTSYPKWKHVLQGVLADLKKRGEITHDSGKHTYTF